MSKRSTMYSVSAVLFLVPLIHWIVGLLPWHLGQAQWRTAAAASLGHALVLPIAGVLLAFAVALWTGDERAKRSLAAASGCAAALLFSLALHFALAGALGTAATVDPVVNMGLAGSLLLLGLGAASASVAGFRSVRRPAAREESAALPSPADDRAVDVDEVAAAAA